MSSRLPARLFLAAVVASLLAAPEVRASHLFGPAATYPGGTGATAPVLHVADASRDGNLDLFWQSGTNLHVLLGNGSGAFGGLLQFPTRLASTAPQVASADLNADDVPDTVHGPGAGVSSASLMLGTGIGSFAATLLPLPRASEGSPFLADADADGDLDIYLVGRGLTLLRNDGTATFTVVADEIGTVRVALRSVVVGDLNGDGRADLVAPPFDGSGGPLVYVMGTSLATGLPAIVQVVDPMSSLDPNALVQLGDFDGDGDLDVVAHGSSGGAAVTRVLRQDAGLRFTPQAASPSLLRSTGGGADVLAVDLDDDGALDVVIGCADPDCRMLVVHHGNGAGGLEPATYVPILLAGDRLEAADIDCDGDTDVVAGGTDVAVALNLGARRFEDEVDVTLGGDDLVLADLNEDGFLDIATLSAGGVQVARGTACGMPGVGACQNPLPEANAGADVERCVLPVGQTTTELSGAASRPVGTSGPIIRFCWTTDDGFFAESGVATHCSTLPTATLVADNGPGLRTTTVTLVVTDVTGCSDDDAVAIVTTSQPIVTVADVSNDMPCVDEGIDFFARATNTFSSIGLVTMTWDFDVLVDSNGNGDRDDDADAVVVAVSGQLGVTSTSYATAGPRTARVTASIAGADCTDFADVDLLVGGRPSLVTMSGPTETCPGEGAVFSATLSPMDAGALLTWDFDTTFDADANGDPADDVQAVGTPVTWIFATEGVRTVRVTATGTNRCKSFRERVVGVFPVPMPSFTATSPACNSPIVTFRDMSAGAGPFTVIWDFGDGRTSVGDEVTHVYRAPGRYTVTQTIVDANRCEATSRRDVVVADVRLEILGIRVLDGQPGTGSVGNGNGFAEPGETVAIVVEARNTGGEVATGVEAAVAVVTPASGATVTQATAPLPALEPGVAEESAVPGLAVALSPNMACGSAVTLDVTVQAFGNSGCAATRRVSFVTGAPDLQLMGAERRVTFSPGPSEDPAAAFVTDSHVIVFSDDVGDGAQIYFARTISDGSPVQGPTLVSLGTPQGARALAPRVSANPGASQAGVAWRQLGGGGRVVFLRMTQTGEVLGGPLQLGVGGMAGNPDVAWNGDAYVIAWPDRGAQGEGIFAALVAEDGMVPAPALFVSEPGDGALRHDHVRVAAGGGTWLATYVRTSLGGAGLDLRVRLYRADRPAVLIPLMTAAISGVADEPAAVAAVAGGYLVAFTTAAGTVEVAFFSEEGELLAMSAVGTGSRPTLATGPEMAMVAWQSPQQEVLAQGVDMNGRVFGAVMAVSGGDGPSRVPAASASPDGRFLAAWMDTRSGNGFNPEVFLAILQPTGPRECVVVILGDVAPQPGGDGLVNIGDVVLLLRVAVGLEPVTAQILLRGDLAPGVRIGTVHRVVGNGVIDVADVVVLLQAATGIVTLTR